MGIPTADLDILDQYLSYCIVIEAGTGQNIIFKAIKVHVRLGEKR